MNLSFSKNRKASLIIICICALFYSFNSTDKNKVEDPFLTLCKNSDAYYSYSYTDVSYIKNWLQYKKYISINNKLVVNNTTGVENYAFLNLNEYVSNNIENIKIKTLKSDGSIVELDSSLIFQQNFKDKKFGAINYPIPAVEPGDTIETSYVYSESLKKTDLLSYVNLYTNLPSKNSQYTIKTSSDLTVRYKSYNDFPEPAIISNDSLVYLQFSMDKVKGFVESEYSCIPCELPYLYYSLENKNSELRTWKDVYNEEFNFLTQPIALDYEKSSYYKRWKRNVIGAAKDSSKYYKFNLLHTEVLNNFKMESVQKNEFIKSSGYFLKEKKFDPFSIRRFYRQILEDLEIEYWAVFGRSKRLGAIDTHYIRKGEYDHVFFAFENENGYVKFLYPHNDFYMYQIDEIPTPLYSTDAVLVKPYLKEKKKKKDKFIARDLKLAMVDSVTVAEINLPGMDSNHNYINQTIFTNVDVEEKKTYFKYRFKVSGGLSTELRTFFEILNQNEKVSNFYDVLSEFEGSDKTMQIDTVKNIKLNRNKPYAYSMNTEGTLNNVITFINDSLVSISVDKLIQHNQLISNSDTSELNYYLDYSYSDNFMFYINFPCNIEVLGLENGNLDFKNDYGEYFFELKKSKKNQLKLQSNYKIIKNLIPKENYNKLKLLNERVKNVKSKRLIIKLKSS
ncbi:DUF3857 domain-containing protein [Flavobacteriaceae bacterium AU392]|nr:DUF3857 domain-containing protein [Flavobacteriaceae bacterium]RKM83694.1 DUF3857 domain-containing protein [Flavobacteriaceae bacterium AU392]